jgi:hypothetical protein
VARILDQKTATSGVKNRLKWAENPSKVGIYIEVRLKANQKVQRTYQKEFSLHFQTLPNGLLPIADDISWSRDACHIKHDQMP